MDLDRVARPAAEQAGIERFRRDAQSVDGDQYVACGQTGLLRRAAVEYGR